MKKENYIVKLEKINLTYNKGKDNAFVALKEINLKVEQGEFLVVFGPSGCGKSSLLNIIAGLEKPDSGSIFIEDREMSLLNKKELVGFHRKKIGMVFQAYNLISTLNILENIALPQMFINENKNKRTKRALEIMDNFGIKEFWKKIPTELSGGQQQRVGIARAIINDPLIILADEPIGNLDTVSANRVMEILGGLNKKFKKTIILVSHNPENIIWGSHIIYMKDGKIIKEEFKDIQDSEEKTEIVNKEELTESKFDQLTDRFKGLSEEQINILINPMKAQFIVQSLLIPYEENQIKQMEKIIREKLVGIKNYDQMYQELDRDMEKGGAGLDSRTAINYFNQIRELIDFSEKIKEQEDIENQSDIILNFLHEKNNLTVEEKQANLLSQVIKERIARKISYEKLKKILDDDLKLDRRKVRKIMRTLDLVMLVSYGMEKKNINKTSELVDNLTSEKTSDLNDLNKKNESPFL